MRTRGTGRFRRHREQPASARARAYALDRRREITAEWEESLDAHVTDVLLEADVERERLRARIDELDAMAFRVVATWAGLIGPPRMSRRRTHDAYH